MMMIGDYPRSNPTVQIPPWNHHYVDDHPTAYILSPSSEASRYERYLPSNRNDVVKEEEDDFDLPVDSFSSDNFRMYEFKVKKCARARSHDWTECPFAHPGEKARRRDPRRHHYTGSACPDFRRGACEKGDVCEYAHGVFECWLHPDRYRTLPCKDGTHCRRRVCFFAHTPEQLRNGSPTRSGDDAPGIVFGSSPKSTLYSPPTSPTTESPPISPSIAQITASMRCLQLNKMQLGLSSPRGPIATRPGFYSLPSTPIRRLAPPGRRAFDAWEISCREEPLMERVESGRELREKIYAKLGKENSLDRARSAGPVPDLGWVSELVN